VDGAHILWGSINILDLLCSWSDVGNYKLLDLYDSNGDLHAYTDDQGIIHDSSGTPIAYFSKELIYTFSGFHIGSIDGGIVRDLNGDIFLFTGDFFLKHQELKSIMRPISLFKKFNPMKGVIK
jgi:hypothetical protein